MKFFKGKMEELSPLHPVEIRGPLHRHSPISSLLKMRQSIWIGRGGGADFGGGGGGPLPTPIFLLLLWSTPPTPPAAGTLTLSRSPLEYSSMSGNSVMLAESWSSLLLVCLSFSSSVSMLMINSSSQLLSETSGRLIKHCGRCLASAPELMQSNSHI